MYIYIYIRMCQSRGVANRALPALPPLLPRALPETEAGVYVCYLLSVFVVFTFSSSS